MAAATVTVVDVIMAIDYRIDELAREAGTTVRNVRAYQDRGLLPPPRLDVDGPGGGAPAGDAIDQRRVTHRDLLVSRGQYPAADPAGRRGSLTPKRRRPGPIAISSTAPQADCSTGW